MEHCGCKLHEGVSVRESFPMQHKYRCLIYDLLRFVMNGGSTAWEVILFTCFIFKNPMLVFVQSRRKDLIN